MFSRIQKASLYAAVPLWLLLSILSGRSCPGWSKYEAHTTFRQESHFHRLFFLFCGQREAYLQQFLNFFIFFFSVVDFIHLSSWWPRKFCWSQIIVRKHRRKMSGSSISKKIASCLIKIFKARLLWKKRLMIVSDGFDEFFDDKAVFFTKKIPFLSLFNDFSRH